MYMYIICLGLTVCTHTQTTLRENNNHVSNFNMSLYRQFTCDVRHGDRIRI